MKKHYKNLVLMDDLISEQLKTPEGRVNYWNGLLEDAQKYDLIDLLKKSVNLDGDIIEFCSIMM